MPRPTRWLTPREASETRHKHITTIYRWIRENKIGAHKCGPSRFASVLVDEDSLDEFIAASNLFSIKKERRP